MGVEASWPSTVVDRDDIQFGVFKGVKCLGG